MHLSCSRLPFIFLSLISTIFVLPQSILAQGASDGLGQCYWIGGQYASQQGIKWGYTSATNFTLTEGDSWAAVEPVKGQYNWTGLRSSVNKAVAANKKVWLQLTTADQTNKEHNIPKWAIDEGIEMFDYACGNKSYYKYYITYGATGLVTLNTIKEHWNNPQLLDQSEAICQKTNGAVVACGGNWTDVATVKFPVMIAAIWDPAYQNYYLNALRALKQEFNTEIANGTISAFNLNSGGHYGESAFSPRCPGWDTSCGIPDVLNTQCQITQSMARSLSTIKGRTITPADLAKKSNCSPQNLIPGNEVQLCTLQDQNQCPKDRGSYCYVIDDYFVQSMKEFITQQVQILDGLPLVWQTGTGPSGNGRTKLILQDWMSSTFGSRIWMKWNGWSADGSYYYSASFNSYGNKTRHGYEMVTTDRFSRAYWNTTTATNWCNNANNWPTLTKPSACNSADTNPNEVARLAIATAIKKGIVDDKSSFLCLSSRFFESSPLDRGAGKAGNDFFYNPLDNTTDCSNSEINTASYGVGFCPGFLNYTMDRVPSPNSPSPLPTISSMPTPTISPVASASPSPLPSPSPDRLLNRFDLNSDEKINDQDLIMLLQAWTSYNNNFNKLVGIITNWRN